ncbi:serine hydrolase domain-containing protein [Paenibacillus sacheonensis]|uniref:Serine hydrolase n=1 Tax=Paenibacillus sacheonensis TaxID=742054 RepID=A0A7X5BYX7_9BACL|nr:serine hydrolase domain-containing protein [Paenibacillus sacheonensis]MBM7565105.1 CubicO group peptidase (beta-lactamase class C family) [Paenibacillus sacheonensis]NBC70112.1 serine hydrolase [Paenibacillus sacheonensis]
MFDIRSEINAIVNDFHKDNHLSGAILLTQEREVLYEKAYGQADVQFGVDNTLETKFFVASVTKMFIAAAVLKLHEEGILNLHAHPGSYLDQLQHVHRGITLHHLLSHTSGLHDIYAVPDLRYEMSKLNHGKGDFLAYLSKQEQRFNPGERWGYSSTGFIMLGYMLEKVAGKSFEALLDEMFFKPLSMKDTGLHNPRQIIKKRAYGYTIDNGECRNAEDDKLAEIEAPGELYSTVKDLQLWCEAIDDGSILSQASRELMFNSYASVDFDPRLNYGYGWFLGNDYRWIPGGSPGYKADIWQFPERKRSLIMLWNFEKVNAYALFERMRNCIAR